MNSFRNYRITTGVETKKGSSKTLGSISNFIATYGVTKDKVAPGYNNP